MRIDIHELNSNAWLLTGFNDVKTPDTRIISLYIFFVETLRKVVSEGHLYHRHTFVTLWSWSDFHECVGGYGISLKLSCEVFNWQCDCSHLRQSETIKKLQSNGKVKEKDIRAHVHQAPIKTGRNSSDQYWNRFFWHEVRIWCMVHTCQRNYRGSTPDLVKAVQIESSFWDLFKSECKLEKPGCLCLKAFQHGRHSSCYLS